jgi:KipI family sensor histidine kinase inhibitor
VIQPFGEHALLVELDGSSRGRALASSLTRDRPAGVDAAVPGLASVLVELDPASSDRAAEIADEIAHRLEALAPAPSRGRTRVIPVAYGGEHGPDLEEAAALVGLPPAELVDRHARAQLEVLFCGFAPGFAYLGDLPDRLRVPRLATPRTRTPPGSVAIAGAMTGIYPAELPGGWRIIGRTPLTLFDPQREPPAYLAPGDTVRFAPIETGAWPGFSRPADDW